MTRYLSFCYRTGLLLIAILTICGEVSRAQTTFIPGTAIAVTKAGPNDTTAAYTIYTSDNVLNPTAFTAGASFNNGWHLNGFGFNKRDSLLYGAAYTGDTLLAGTLFNVTLYRLDATGQLKNLGKLPTSGQSNPIGILGGIRAEIPNYNAGFVDSIGRYFYLTLGINQAGITKMANAWVSYTFGGEQHPNPGLVTSDVKLYLCWINNVHLLDSTNMPTTVAGFRKIDFSDPSVTGAVQLLVDDLNAVFPHVAYLKGGMQDFARSPSDNSFYGYISYPTGDTAGDSIAGRPVIFVTGTEANTFVVQPVGNVENLTPQAEIAGTHFDVTGQMFCLFDNGQYGRIDLATGALINPAQSNIPLAEGLLWGDMAGVAHEGTLPPDPEAIEVSTLNNVPATITTPGGQLQMAATILPAAASQTVEWSVYPAGGQATIDNTGNVTAVADGQVYIKAIAAGFPGVADSMAVQISHQHDTTTAIDRIAAAKNGLKVYPNPAGNTIWLQPAGDHKIEAVRITDMAGRECRQYTFNNTAAGPLAIELAGLPPGVYLLQVTSDRLHSATRLLISR